MNIKLLPLTRFVFTACPQPLHRQTVDTLHPIGSDTNGYDVIDGYRTPATISIPNND
ncbi:hypothetical protein ACI6Q2_18920 [Chitinophagaceae bacterium LWZ2-11]